MSIVGRIAELAFTGVKVLGKATAAAGAQAVRNFKHKPEGAPSNSPIGTGGSKSQITNQLNMSLDEAHLILNVKKDDPLEVIQKSYERIFAANGPPPPPAAPASASTSAAGTGPGARPIQQPPKRPVKGPAHSHYLHSKVYRALERIKAERGDAEAGSGGGAAPAAGAGAGEAGSGTAAAPPGSGTTAAGPSSGPGPA